MSYVLLIEDNPDNAGIVIRLLESANYTVRHFVRGLDGVRAAQKERPALILMDFNLPDVDGRTLSLVMKRQLGGNNAPPIIAITARTGLYEEMMAERFGCSAFVSKPFDPQQLLDLIDGMIGEVVSHQE
jgi:two-component system, chemotaxis family, chemotaxis protein CheY